MGVLLQRAVPGPKQVLRYLSVTRIGSPSRTDVSLQPTVPASRSAGRITAFDGPGRWKTMRVHPHEFIWRFIPDTSISGIRIAHELNRLLAERGKPKMIVSDNGTELTSNAILQALKRIAGLPARKPHERL